MKEAPNQKNETGPTSSNPTRFIGTDELWEEADQAEVNETSEDYEDDIRDPNRCE